MTNLPTRLESVLLLVGRVKRRDSDRRRVGGTERRVNGCALAPSNVFDADGVLGAKVTSDGPALGVWGMCESRTPGSEAQEGRANSCKGSVDP